MFNEYLLLSLLLLVGTEATKFPNDPALVASFKTVVISLEIMDYREGRYFLCRPDDYTSDYLALRRRYETFKNAPMLWEINRFPSKEVATECRTFNRQYLQFVEREKAISDFIFWGEVENETEQLYYTWDAIYDASNDGYYIPVRRQALMSLRHKLGEDAFQRGWMPPCVPAWRFYSLDN